MGGRVAGKVGYAINNYNGHSYRGLNEEIIYISIGMGITIAVLITIALCYIMREHCQKRPRKIAPPRQSFVLHVQPDENGLDPFLFV